MMRSLKMFRAFLVLLPKEMSASDNFKAYGLPIFLLVILGVTTFLNHKKLTQASKTNIEVSAAWLLRFSILNVILSIFLFFTAAWALALLSAIICYVIALSVGTGNLRPQSEMLLKIQGLYFCILVGEPDFLNKSTGSIFSRISGTVCFAFYADASDHMCASGWLTFAEIIAGVVVGLNFVSLMIITSFAAAHSAGDLGESAAFQEMLIGGTETTSAVSFAAGMMGESAATTDDAGGVAAAPRPRQVVADGGYAKQKDDSRGVQL